MLNIKLSQIGLDRSAIKDASSLIPHLANSHNSNLLHMIYFIRKCDFPQIDEYSLLKTVMPI